MAGKVQTAAGPSGQMRRPAGSGERMEQQMPKKKKKAKRFYDYSLLFCIIFLTAFGLVMIYSASSYSAQLSKAYKETVHILCRGRRESRQWDWWPCSSFPR